MDSPALYHFSDDPSIQVFRPRPSRGGEGVPNPAVWAIDDAHQFMYFFPRECPRVLLWPTVDTSEADRARWLARSDTSAIAYVEYDWFERLRSTHLYRYRMPNATFEDLRDAGMWASRRTVVPDGIDEIDDLVDALRRSRVELRLMEKLTPLHGLWNKTTLHWSGIRLRNAKEWAAASG